MKYDFQANAKLAKRCPCCGSKAILTEKPEWIAAHGLTSVGIECDNCGLEVHGHANEYNEAYRKALIKWNRRAA